MKNAPDHSLAKPAQGEAVRLTADHLAQALALSQAIHWPYRAEDWAFALNLGRGYGIETDGRLVGTALWWPYGTDFASLGMIIVAEDAQRQGIGARLMNAMLADAAGRNIVLNSTQEGELLYTRLGFKPYGAVHQYQAVLGQAPAIETSSPIRATTPDDRAALQALDQRAAGMDRTALLNALHPMADFIVTEHDGQISGYACVRRWGRGVVIGPVIARDAADAKALIATLAARHVGDFVRIDVTRASGLSAWIEAIGLPQVGEVTTMALGSPPKGSPDATLFALSNQSLG